MNFNHDDFNLLSELGYEPTMEEQMAAQPENNNSSNHVSKAPSAATTSGAVATSNKPKKGLTELPPDFTPSNYSVILGRGKGAYNYVGNKRCRVIVKSFLGEYNKCNTRQERSVQVTKVLDIIREACPVGAFVKNENGSWYSVDEKIAREKIFTMFRDCQNSQTRRSSSSSLRSSIRSTSSSPHKMTAVQIPQAPQGMMMVANMPEPEPIVQVPVPVVPVSSSSQLPPPLANVFAPQLQQQQLQQPQAHAPEQRASLNPADVFDFEPIKFEDGDEDDSLGESLGSNCGSFYDIDSCSLCTI